MRTFQMRGQVILALMVALLMGGCTVLPGPVVLYEQPMFSGGKVSRQHPYSLNKDVRITVKEDEQGLVSFSVRETGIGQGDLDWILTRVDELKGRCPSGGIMRRYEIASSERSTPNSRRLRGDISVTIEYHCNRNKPGNTRRNQGDWS